MSKGASFTPKSMGSAQFETLQTDSINLKTEEKFPLSDQLESLSEGMDECGFLRDPEIKILTQPIDKFRFRYKSEMLGTHGCLLGDSSDINKKEFPTVQVINCSYEKPIVRCTLVTVNEEKRYPHPHHLVKKYGTEDLDDPHDLEVTDETKYIAVFQGMGIIHTAKKNIRDEILKKTKRILLEKKRMSDINAELTIGEIQQLKRDAEDASKWVNLNTVALCFQCFIKNDAGVIIPITEAVYTRPINNLKSALTGELKISRISKVSSPCEGDEEIWMLCDKVGKRNIRIKFYELDAAENEIWSALGRFSDIDVHHQYAIVFKTPAYASQEIETERKVFLKLERPSDGEFSNSIQFTYKPSKKLLNKLKRPRLSVPLSEFSRHIAPTKEINLHIPKTEKELKECHLLEDVHKAIKDYDLQIFQDITEDDFLRYLSFLDDNSLKFDGPSAGENVFTRNILRKICKILKKHDSESPADDSLTKQIKSLFKETTVFGDNALHSSLRCKQYLQTESLLKVLGIIKESKDIVNSTNSRNETPLHLAVKLNQPQIVKALLTLKADPNNCNEDDWTCLHTAIDSRADACVDEILDSKVQINLEAQTDSGWSSLHFAAKSGCLHCIKALIEAGADINATDLSFGRTALHIAVESNFIDIVSYLASQSKVRISLKNSGGNTPLRCAQLKFGKRAAAIVRVLKKHGADSESSFNENRMKLIHSSTAPTTTLTTTNAATTINAKENESIKKDNSYENFQRTQEIPLNGINLQQDFIIDQPVTFIKSECDEEFPEVIEESSLSNITITDVRSEQPEISVLDNRSDISTPVLNITDVRSINPINATIKVCNIRPESIQASFMAKKDFRSEYKPSMNKHGVKIFNPVTEKNIDNEMEKLSVKEELQDSDYDDSDLEHSYKNLLLKEEHMKRIALRLDESGAWEKLAEHTKHTSLIRLYRKHKNPSMAVLKKIKLSNPDITVLKMQDLLKEIGQHDIAHILDR